MFHRTANPQMFSLVSTMKIIIATMHGTHDCGHCSQRHVITSILQNNLRDRREILNTCGCQLLNDFLTITMCPQCMLPDSLSSGGRSRTDVYPASPHSPRTDTGNFSFYTTPSPTAAQAPALCLCTSVTFESGDYVGQFEKISRISGHQWGHPSFLLEGQWEHSLSGQKTHVPIQGQWNPALLLCGSPAPGKGAGRLRLASFLLLTLTLSWWSFLAWPLILNHTNPSPWPSPPSFSVPSADLTRAALI